MTQYLQGSQEGAVRTAQESNFIQAGSNMRKSTEVYLFSHKVILPLVNTYALFKKELESGMVKTIRHKDEDGNNIYTSITDEVRNGNYCFIIDGNGTAIAREAELRQLFTLLGLPAFQSLLQMVDPTTAIEFLKWVLNRGDFSGTSQLFELLGLNGQLNRLGASVGIRPENQAGFSQDMKGQISQALPELASRLLSQNRQPEQLPQ